ncbi:MAG: hypothetical protein QOK37_3772 [Thermoanaerobaculia bacterium]|jgi:hypothetical protein|nr:hypothetical protein [Thermoanaerobaculia bacterium]
MTATIKLFLPFGDPQRLRTAEISNWNGKGVAAPRTDLAELLKRDECSQSGVYLLAGTEPETGDTACYIGEAEVIRERLRQHKAKDFWINSFIFISKDENLTKAHVRYLEGRLIADAKAAGRVQVLNGQASGARLPESDREDMEVFLSKIRQLLPVLGSDILTPLIAPPPLHDSEQILFCEIKGLKAQGRRTPGGFLVFEGSEAVVDTRPSAPVRHGFVLELRQDLIKTGVLVLAGDRYRFTRAIEFSSPSTAAGVIQGGSANGLTAWRNVSGQTLKELEEPSV